jgi:hypothetical protein
VPGAGPTEAPVPGPERSSREVGQGPSATPSAEPAALELSAEEAELVSAEALAASQALEEPRRSQALKLARAAEAGEVPVELVGLLEQVSLASLQGGRARQLYKAEGERTLVRLLLRTPRGQEIETQLGAVNDALGALRGRPVDEVRVGMRAPGHFTVDLWAGSVGITLTIRPYGVSVESLTA